MTLQRLVLTFTPEGVEVCALYRTKAGPNPGTKARAQEVTTLVWTGLHQALEALARRVDVVGEPGYEVREDVMWSSERKQRDGIEDGLDDADERKGTAVVLGPTRAGARERYVRVLPSASHRIVYVELDTRRGAGIQDGILGRRIMINTGNQATAGV